jgi:hypothetical protein
MINSIRPPPLRAEPQQVRRLGVRAPALRGISAAVKQQDRVQIMLAGLILPALALVAAMTGAFGYFAQTAWLLATGLGVAVWYILGWFIYLAVASRVTHPAWLRNATRPRATYMHATLTRTTPARG